MMDRLGFAAPHGEAEDMTTTIRADHHPTNFELQRTTVRTY